MEQRLRHAARNEKRKWKQIFQQLRARRRKDDGIYFLELCKILKRIEPKLKHNHLHGYLKRFLKYPKQFFGKDIRGNFKVSMDLVERDLFGSLSTRPTKKKNDTNGSSHDDDDDDGDINADAARVETSRTTDTTSSSHDHRGAKHIQKLLARSGIDRSVRDIRKKGFRPTPRLRVARERNVAKKESSRVAGRAVVALKESHPAVAAMERLRTQNPKTFLKLKLDARARHRKKRDGVGDIVQKKDAPSSSFNSAAQKTPRPVATEKARKERKEARRPETSSTSTSVVPHLSTSSVKHRQRPGTAPVL
eukprot:g1864.t1